MTFPSYWECHHPNWRFVIFFGGVGQPPTSVCWDLWPLHHPNLSWNDVNCISTSEELGIFMDFSRKKLGLCINNMMIQWKDHTLGGWSHLRFVGIWCLISMVLGYPNSWMVYNGNPNLKWMIISGNLLINTLCLIMINCINGPPQPSTKREAIKNFRMAQVCLTPAGIFFFWMLFRTCCPVDGQQESLHSRSAQCRERPHDSRWTGDGLLWPLWPSEIQIVYLWYGNVNPGLINPKRLFNREGTMV